MSEWYRDSGDRPRMMLYKILDAVVPGMYDTPCKIAIFTNGRKIKVFEKTCFRSLDFNTPVPQNWVRNYNLEKFKSPRAVEALLREVSSVGSTSG